MFGGSPSEYLNLYPFNTFTWFVEDEYMHVTIEFEKPLISPD
jgi:hypothetical protein